MPWSTRITISASGAQSPMLASVGISPITVVEMPMMKSVRISIFLRPIRSPKWPKMSDPTGRAMKPTANVAKDRTVLIVSPKLPK